MADIPEEVIERAQHFIAQIRAIECSDDDKPPFLTALSIMSAITLIAAAEYTDIPSSVLRDRFISAMDATIQKYRGN